LDERCGRVAVVGLSNWALDPAKMNRAVHLFRPAPSEYDLSCTAKALANDPALRRHLSNLASAYYRIYQSQTQDEFFGLRDFYSLVRTLAVAMKTKDDILQTLYLIDAVLHDHAEADSCKVLLILHLPRRSSSDLFSLDFSDRWDAVFVDVVDEYEAEIDLRRLSSLSLVKVLEDNELDMCQACAVVFADQSCVCNILADAQMIVFGTKLSFLTS
jgi:hypothetical protein